MSDKNLPKNFNTMNSKKLTAVIIGAGRIASGYDTPKSKAVLTHAHALSCHPKVALVGIHDTDSVRGEAEAKKWKTKYWQSQGEMLSVAPDIVVIATPSETHKDLLISAMKVKPKVIIVEKPAVNAKSEIASIRSASKKYGVPVIVNFRRRFDASVSLVRDGLIKGKYGAVLSASGLYTKGILHNGSHMMDLARYLFGEMTFGKALFSVQDFSSSEPTLGGIATFERCPQFHLITGDERSFYVFEMAIVTEKSRIRFVDEGRNVIIEEVVHDKVYPEDRVLAKGKEKKTQLADAMVAMVDHAVQVAEGKALPHSSLEEGLKTQEACYKLLNSFK